MRIAILVLLAATTLPAVELETFTLKDGREIIGSYDEATHTMRAKTLSGFASLTVEPAVITERRPYIERKTPAPPKPVEKPAQPEPEKSKPVPSWAKPVPPIVEDLPKSKIEDLKDRIARQQVAIEARARNWKELQDRRDRFIENIGGSTAGIAIEHWKEMIEKIDQELGQYVQADRTAKNMIEYLTGELKKAEADKTAREQTGAPKE